MRRPIKSKTQSFELNDYEIFPDQAIGKNGDLIEEAMINECEPTDLN